MDVSGNAPKTDISGNAPKTDISGNNVPANSGEKDFTQIFSSVLTSSNFILLVWFLAIFCVSYFIMNFFKTPSPAASTGSSSMGRILDILFLGGLLVYLVITYFTEKDKKTYLNNLYETFKKYIDDSSSLFSTGLFIIAFYIVVYIFQLPMTADAKPISVYLIETVSWVLFAMVLFALFFKEVLGISITDVISKINLWNRPPVVDLSANAVLPPKVDASSCLVKVENPTDEVFNVSNNLYTYKDAQSVCDVYGAKLATYDQIEQAYNKGGEWCNYGWSDGQMAFFPTQKSTWDKLQKTPKHKNSCGRPGVNGGYIANPYIKFGVNCYGKKPKASPEDLKKMGDKQNTVYPKSDAEIAMEKKIDAWKNTLSINSYNNTKWSQY